MTAPSIAALRISRATGRARSSTYPSAVHSAIPTIGEDETSIVMHNDAVVQGLSEIPYMRDADHWGVFTIGTGLGNARFTNRNAVDQ